MLRNFTMSLVASGYHPFVEEDQEEGIGRTWTMLNPDDSANWGGGNVIWKHRVRRIHVIYCLLA